MKKYVGLLLMGLMGASPAIADTVKVGYMTTLSGGAASLASRCRMLSILPWSIREESLAVWKRRSFC